MATPEELLDGAEEVLAAALSFVDDCAGGSHSTTNDAGSGLCLTVPGVDGAALLDLEGHPSPFSDIWPSTPRSASPYDLLSIEPCASPPPLLLGAIALDAPIRHGPSSHPSLQPQTTSARARTAGRSKAAGASRKCHRNSNRVRDEERKEVLRLRSLVAELETRITLLREAKRSTKRVVPQPSSCTGDERVIRIWRESTKLQFEQRLKALGENGRLRQLLERQVKIASALRQLVQNQAAAQAMAYCGLGQAPNWARDELCTSSEAELFCRLFGVIEAAYQRLDAVLRPSSLPDQDQELQRGGDNTPFRTDAAGALSSRVVAEKVFPFGFDATQRAAWQHFGYATRPFASRFHIQRDPQLLPAVADGDNVVVERFMLELGMDETSALFRVRQIVRRFVEPGRTVIILQAYVNPVHFAGRPLQGVAFEESGYIVIQAAESLPAESFASLRTCLDTTTAGRPIASQGGGYERALCDFLVRCKQATTTATHDIIENLLFDQRALAAAA